MTEGVIFDLGYQPHEGKRLGRAGAVRALYRDGLRRVLGLRRRARSKILPALLLSIALLPAILFVGIGVLFAGADFETDSFFSHAEYFEYSGWIALILSALAAGELLVSDRTHGTLAVYASRPLTFDDYLAGRAAALLTIVFGFVYFPHIVFFLGQAWVNPEGFTSYLTGNLDLLWKTAACSAVYCVAFTVPAFLIAAYARRTSVAAGVFFGVFAIAAPTTEPLVREVGIEPLGLLALHAHPSHVKDWIMGSPLRDLREWVPNVAGYGPVVSLIVILAIALITALVVVRRYRRLT